MKSNSIYTVLLLALFCFSLASCGKDEVDSGKGEIIGRITFRSATTGATNVASGAKVYLVKENVCASYSTYDLMVRADASGNYRFSNLSPGKYVIEGDYSGTLFDYSGYGCVTLGKREIRSLNVLLR